jgi:hypothetical protein
MYDEAYMKRSKIVRLRMEHPASGPKKTNPKTDPLLKVAGICRGPRLSERIDEKLYGD